MGQLLELVGSTIIAGFVIMILLRLNSQIGDAATELHEQTYNQRNAVTSGQVFDYDFSKIGYRAGTGNKILQADSNAIKFRADIDNNGTADTVTYSLTPLDSMASTPNPKDRKLLRKVNAANARTATILTQFKIFYYDSVNALINYGSLSSQVMRDKIRSIRTYTKYELPFMVNNTYNPTELTRAFRPKNLR